MSDTETESSTSDHFEDAEESVEVFVAPAPPPAPPPGHQGAGVPLVQATLPSPDIEGEGGE